MNDFFSIKLDKASSVPVYKQLGEGLCVLIKKGALKPNSKLPPIRKMSEALRINSVTVINAYKYLENKKVVYSQIGRGTYVSEILPMEGKNQAYGHQKAMQYTKTQGDFINFAGDHPAIDPFFTQSFSDSMLEIIMKERDIFINPKHTGLSLVTKAMEKYMERYSIEINKSNKIIIFNNMDQGVDFAKDLTAKEDGPILIEAPSAVSSKGIFNNHPHIFEIPMYADGIDIKRLETVMGLNQQGLLHIMPLYQNPTGVVYSQSKREAILELADKYDFYILEEDNNFDGGFNEEPVKKPMKAMDVNNRVIYLKGFSKIILPSLSFAVGVLPENLLSYGSGSPFKNAPETDFFHRTIAHYYATGKDYKHLNCVKKSLNENLEQACKLIDELLGKYVKYIKPTGGAYLWLKLIAFENHRAMGICERLMASGVAVAPGDLFYFAAGGEQYLRLSILNVNSKQITRGVHIMKDVFDAMALED